MVKFLKNIYLFTNEYLYYAGLPCSTGLSLVVASRGSFLVAMRRLLIVVAPLVVHRLSGTRALVVVTQGLSSCSLQAPDYRIISCEEWTQLSCCLWGSSETRDQTSVPSVAR